MDQKTILGPCRPLTLDQSHAEPLKNQPGLTFSTKAIATSSFEACSSDTSPISPFLPGMGSRPSNLAATSRSCSEVLVKMTWMKGSPFGVQDCDFLVWRNRYIYVYMRICIYVYTHIYTYLFVCTYPLLVGDLTFG